MYSNKFLKYVISLTYTCGGMKEKLLFSLKIYFFKKAQYTKMFIKNVKKIVREYLFFKKDQNFIYIFFVMYQQYYINLLTNNCIKL